MKSGCDKTHLEDHSEMTPYVFQRLEAIEKEMAERDEKKEDEEESK